MIEYDIPGREIIYIENLVLDYNGTLAVEGKLLPGVDNLLKKLTDLKIYILTADTRGSARKECEKLPVQLITFPQENAGMEKLKIVRELGGEKTIVVGNGFNDIPMFKESILSIAVIQEEGLCGQLLAYSDIVTTSILDALNILVDKDKTKATLRN